MKCPMCEDIEVKANQEDTSQKAVSCEAEYNALREEKIFRYGYSNQINTALLTITLTIFSIGVLWFTIETRNKKMLEFANYIFPLFFLLPCFFAKICFRCSLRNSVRIGLLSEYLRNYSVFQSQSSWETIKQKKGLHYFYNEKSKIGGAKEMPICVSIASIVFSTVIGRYPLFDYISHNLCMFFLMITPLLSILLFGILRQFAKKRIITTMIFFFSLSTTFFLYALNCHLFSDCSGFEALVGKQMLFDSYLYIAAMSLPKFNEEIKEANDWVEEKTLKIKEVSK